MLWKILLQIGAMSSLNEYIPINLPIGLGQMINPFLYILEDKKRIRFHFYSTVICNSFFVNYAASAASFLGSLETHYNFTWCSGGTPTNLAL
jgi:hypothetical protein